MSLYAILVLLLAGMTQVPAGGIIFRCATQAADFLADEGFMQRLAVAYDEQLFPIAAFPPDPDFLRVCPSPTQ